MIKETKINNSTAKEVCKNMILDSLNSKKVSDESLEQLIYLDRDGIQSYKALKNIDSLTKTQKEKLLYNIVDKYYGLEDIVIDIFEIDDVPNTYNKILTQQYFKNVDCKEDVYTFAINYDKADRNEILKYFLEEIYEDYDISFYIQVAKNINGINVDKFLKKLLESVNSIYDLITIASNIKSNLGNEIDRKFVMLALSEDRTYQELYRNYIKNNLNEMNYDYLISSYLAFDDNFPNELLKLIKVIKNENISEQSYKLLYESFFEGLDDYYIDESSEFYMFFEFLNTTGKRDLNENLPILFNLIKSDNDFNILLENFDIPDELIYDKNNKKCLLSTLFQNYCNGIDVTDVLINNRDFIQKNNDKLLEFLIDFVNSLTVDDLFIYIDLKSIAKVFPYVDTEKQKIIIEALYTKRVDTAQEVLYYYTIFGDVDKFDLNYVLNLALNLSFSSNALNSFISIMKNIKNGEELILKLRDKLFLENELELLLELGKNYNFIFSKTFLKKVSNNYSFKDLLNCFFNNTDFNNCINTLIEIKPIKTIQELNDVLSFTTDYQLIKRIFISASNNMNISCIDLQDLSLSNTEKMDILMNLNKGSTFDSSNCKEVVNFFLHTRPCDVKLIEEFLIKYDFTGIPSYTLAKNCLDADRTRLFLSCLTKNLNVDNFLQLPNISIPNEYFENLTASYIFNMLMSGNYKNITNKLEHILMIKDSSGQYLYKLLSSDKCLNQSEVYEAIISKKTKQSYFCKRKFKKLYAKEIEEKDEEVLSLELINELLKYDDVLLPYKKIEFKIERLLRLGVNQGILRNIKQSIKETLAINPTLLSNDNVKKEILDFFNSINDYLLSIEADYTLSNSYINDNLNKIVAKEINKTSNAYKSMSKENLNIAKQLFEK